MSDQREGSTWNASGMATEVEEDLRRIESLRVRVATFGHQIKAGSRIDLYERQLRPFLDPKYHPHKDPDFNPAVLAHGSRDFHEVNFICEKLATSHPDDLARALSHLLSGSAIPNEEGQNQISRNLQFQFFTAARLIHSGFSLTLEEPDAVFVHGETELGIAAKRPVKGTKVVLRVREAIQQLGKRELNGFIALSLDQLLPVSNSYFRSKSPEDIDPVAQKLVVEALKPYAKDILETISRTTITGLIVSYTVVGCVRVPWQPIYSSATIMLPRSDELVPENRIVKEIIRVLRHPYL